MKVFFIFWLAVISQAALAAEQCGKIDQVQAGATVVFTFQGSTEIQRIYGSYELVGPLVTAKASGMTVCVDSGVISFKN